MLGVFIGSSGLEEKNWRPRVTAVENCLCSWRLRKLSFRGCVCLALSRCWYVASLLPMPDCVLGDLNRMISFLWGDKNDLVARAVVIQALEFGGFSVVSLQLKVWS